MTPRKAGRRKSGTGRRVKAWALVDCTGIVTGSLTGRFHIYRHRKDAVLPPCFRVVPCEIVIGRRK